MENGASMETLLNALRAVRIPAAPGEYDLHALVATALAAANISYAHEALLAPGRRADFLVGDIAIEIKKGRPPRARLLTQAAKYLQCPCVSALIVVSQRNVVLPRTISGKPVFLLCLDRLWGVSLP